MLFLHDECMYVHTYTSVASRFVFFFYRCLILNFIHIFQVYSIECNELLDVAQQGQNCWLIFFPAQSQCNSIEAEMMNRNKKSIIIMYKRAFITLLTRLKAQFCNLHRLLVYFVLLDVSFHSSPQLILLQLFYSLTFVISCVLRFISNFFLKSTLLKSISIVLLRRKLRIVSKPRKCCQNIE